MNATIKDPVKVDETPADALANDKKDVSATDTTSVVAPQEDTPKAETTDTTPAPEESSSPSETPETSDKVASPNPSDSFPTDALQPGFANSNSSLQADKEVKTKKPKGEIKLDAASLRTAGSKASKHILRYASLLFFLLIAAVYGFVVLRINLLSSAQPTQSDIDAQTTTTPIPRIDPNIAKRLETLEDNSQNVQVLFDEARKNPFD